MTANGVPDVAVTVAPFKLTGRGSADFLITIKSPDAGEFVFPCDRLDALWIVFLIQEALNREEALAR